MYLHPYCGYLITLSNDLTIRIWDMEKYEQVYEFNYPAEDRCTILACHPKSMMFAAGFQTGIIRAFDIEKTCVIE